MTTRLPIDALAASVGRTFGPGPWRRIDQARIDRFAAITGDAQWIHTDPARARAASPYRATVAHGLLTLSLLPGMVMELVEVEGATSVVNYGFNRVRFPAPVLAGSSLRLRMTVAEVTALPGGVQLTLELLLENDRQDKPACAAELLFRYSR